MPKILIRMPDMAFMASAQAFMVEPVVITSSTSRMCLFFNVSVFSTRKMSSITSLPHSFRVERDRQKEIDGVEQPCLPVGGSSHASQFVSEFFVSMIF